jgi:hypothetical protein
MFLASLLTWLGSLGVPVASAVGVDPAVANVLAASSNPRFPAIVYGLYCSDSLLMLVPC